MPRSERPAYDSFLPLFAFRFWPRSEPDRSRPDETDGTDRCAGPRGRCPGEDRARESPVACTPNSSDGSGNTCPATRRSSLDKRGSVPPECYESLGLMRPALRQSFRSSACIPSYPAPTPAGLPSKIISKSPDNSARCRRYASRNQRRNRFRSCALPSFRGVTKPTRPFRAADPVSPADRYITTNRRPVKRRPPEKILENSRPVLRRLFEGNRWVPTRRLWWCVLRSLGLRVLSRLRHPAGEERPSADSSSPCPCSAWAAADDAPSCDDGPKWRVPWSCASGSRNRADVSVCVSRAGKSFS